jgi:hypothetical protein
VSMAIRDWFGGSKKAASDEAAESAPEAAPPQGASPAATPAPPAAVEGGAPPAEAAIDFVAILTAAGIKADARERVVKAKQLLRTMPVDGPSATMRKVVEAAFQAFEIPTEKIIDAASTEIDALQAYIRAGEDDKTAKLAAGERRIADLEGQIREVRATMAQVVAAQERRQRLTSEEIATVEPILKFFGRDASPKAASSKESPPDVDVVEVDESLSSPP